MDTRTQAAPRRPFGPPAIELTPLVGEVAREEALPPAELFARVRAAGTPGAALLESAGAGPDVPTVRRSLVVTRALLRLELHGGEARVTPLLPEGEALLAPLERRLAGARRSGEALVAPYPREPGDPGLEDEARLRAPGPLDIVRALVGLVGDAGGAAPLAPGLFGAFAYELVDAFERLPARRPDPHGEPDGSFVLATDLVLYDEVAGRVRVITRGLAEEPVGAVWARHKRVLGLVAAGDADAGSAGAPAAPADASPGDGREVAARWDLDAAAFEARVRALLEAIRDGEVFQAVPSRGFEVRSAADPLAVYRALRATNPSPYLFHLDLGRGVLLGASPETFLRVEAGELEIRPIAGTVPRGRRADGSLDRDLDDRLALSLSLDPKEQAEHAMLLDLARNDVARVSEPGTTRVAACFTVEKYSHVQHLVSSVVGRLRGGLDALHAYRAAANMGTLTGAPKVRAMELLREAEPTARGFYGGAAGYVLADGTLDTCIVIRSLRHADERFWGRSGAGVVADSDPARELRETELKASACLAAIALAEGERS